VGNLAEPNDTPRRCHRCGRTLRGRQACDCIRIVDPAPSARRRDAAPEERGDWTESVVAGSDVRGQLARWRGIRERSWVRRRVMTGEAGPLAPPAPEAGPSAPPAPQDAANDSGAADRPEPPAPTVRPEPPAPTVRPEPPAPTARPVQKARAAHPPPARERRQAELDERPQTVIVLGPGARTIEDTSEVHAVPAELHVTFDAPTDGGRVSVFVVALALTLAAVGVAWAIVALY
jgi:hypothetical protein